MDEYEEGPLAGVRVLDLAPDLGAYATTLLAAFGADVIKVEPPSGDPLRSSGTADLFAYYHQGKRGITLDVSRPEAAVALQRLGRTADVVLLEPGARRRVTGYDPGTGTVDWAPAHAVVCCLTPFGRTGPWRDLRTTPLVSYALSGLMWRLGPPEGPPIAPPGRQLYDQLGGHAAAAILVALRERPLVGGQVVDLSLHELQSSQDDQIDRYDRDAVFGSRHAAAPSPPPTGVWKCADGLVEILAHNPAHWDGLVAVLGKPDGLQDAELRQRHARALRAGEIASLVREHLAGRSVREVVAALQAHGVPCAEQFTPGDLVADPHPAAREFWTETRRPDRSTLRVPGIPFRSEPPLAVGTSSAPGLGEHDDEVYLTDLGIAPTVLAQWREAGLVAR